jgi:hypothetical protein
MQRSGVEPEKVLGAAGVASVARKQAVVPRPDRAGKVAMTTRGSPRLRQLYKELAARVDTTMEELQLVALRSFLANFRRAKLRSEQRAVWEALRREFPEYGEGEDDAD